MATQLETTSVPILRRGLHGSVSLAFLGLAAADIVMKVAGFNRLYRTVKNWPISKNGTNDRETIAGICASVDRATTYYPKHALCLQRSAVATCLLRRKGVPAEMVIGCRKMPFHSHAWVEVDGEVVNDKQKVAEFYKILARF
jgi:hypothetical protein